MNGLLKKISAKYRELFSIEEIENSVALQLVLLASLFVFYITFHSWMVTKTITVENAELGRHLCWPYFTSCGDWYFLSALPFGYSQNLFYMILFGVMTVVAVSLWKKRWNLAHFGLLLLLIWEVLFLFVFNISKRGNYDYYQVVLTTIVLFFPYKFEFLRIAFCCLYFLAASIKIHEGWILGTYFSSLKIGMPLFPNELTPIFTNTVIFMEMVGTWFLLSSNPLLQRLALTFFIIFHWYSGLIVWYRYPATIMPYLLILFGPLYGKAKVPLTIRSLPNWIFISALAVLQSISFIIPKDSKVTFEGLNFGLYMFDSNHQCISAREIVYKNGATKTDTKEMASSRSRCDPYYRLFKIWTLCERQADKVEKVRWRFLHSTNGGPFYKIVDEENACELEYKVLQHNDWIITPDEGAKIMGYPVKNLYY